MVVGKFLGKFLLLCCVFNGMAQEQVCDSVEIHFRQSKTDIDFSLRSNSEALNRIADSLRLSRCDSTAFRLVKVKVEGAASPEGSVKFNRWLSEQRAIVLFDYLKTLSDISAPEMSHDFLGRDWKGLYVIVANDSKVPYKEEALNLIQEFIDYGGLSREGTDPINKLKHLRRGEPYIYMYHYLFPLLRRSKVTLWYEEVPNPQYQGWLYTATPAYEYVASGCPDLTPEYTIIPHEAKQDVRKPFYMAIKTNMLYDAVAMPNIGAEFYLGKNLSIAGDWVYGWWRKPEKHRYWRYYGGELTLRRWLGRKAAEKPLQGHHLGVYAQCFTYCFEWGGKGEIGGVPAGAIWDKCQYGGGLEYGYSFPVRPRLNIELAVAAGYVAGQYWEFDPVGKLNVWRATKEHHYFGPTKLAVSLVWLIGRGNVNKKGGRR